MATAEYAVTSPAGTSHESAVHGSMPLNVQSVIGQPIIDVNGLNGDSSDSRKRPLETMDSEFEMGLTKRSNVLLGPDENKYIVKLLIPSTVAGSIIGKGGQTIAQLQRDTGTNIKLSKANDFYPGTSERVALLTGTVEALNSVAHFIIEKVRESPQLGLKAGVENITTPERARQVKVVVPNSTAGLIIGKGGSMIKSIMEQSGARVQISQKSEGVTLSERVITITGELDADLKALSFIIAKVQEDPQSGSCNNLSYATVTGPVANANPTGSPFAETIPGVATNLAAAAAAAASLGKSPLPSAVATPVAGSVQQTALPSGQIAVTPSLVRIPTSLPGTASAPSSDSSSLNAALSSQFGGYTIPNLGTFGGLPFGATNPLLGATAPNMLPHMLPSGLVSPYSYTFPPTATHTAAAAAMAAAAAASSPKTTHAASSPTAVLEQQTLPTTTSPSTTMASPVTIPITVPTAQIHSAPETIMQGFPFSTPLTAASIQAFPGVALSTESPKDPSKETIVEVEVPESLVGAILGKSGKTLVEFQNYSGAKIQISKKGEFVPGTRNRKVTIKGPLTSTQTAHFLVTQRVAQEEQNRALKGTT
ncbi:RNA-binding protein Nova-1 [Holothuria leucospilota]|uniref:RNA-binding protein Nova-1 n=1 Tax=Holothuria leucospilota TaxID=206669 RepID=A0A9Q1CH42_HOLLE|nr:RNA-binding protein Nova-1 [Holothuria leucospilota]